MSYNLEANYALPTNAAQFTQDLYDKIFFINGADINDETSARMKSLDFFSRWKIYKMIEEKMEHFGVDGRACLLRIICETASLDVKSSNGFLGNIIHILLT